MAIRTDRLASALYETDELLVVLRPRMSKTVRHEVDTWRSHAAALRFHLRGSEHRSLLVAVLGGTGAGKSTLVNRLLGREICATSFRRTFTTGPVAITSDANCLPDQWLGLDQRVVVDGDLPVRGDNTRITVVLSGHTLTTRLTFIDTPDLDGDSPDHHAVADLVFRWSDAILFVVTPEKYQMTELPGYYRLADRYAVPGLFVMNKCEESAVLDDFQEQLIERAWPDAKVFAIPRDDCSYVAPDRCDFRALTEALAGLSPPGAADRERGLVGRGRDVVDRMQDKVLMPLRETRRVVDRVLAVLTSLRAAGTGVDVAPLAEQFRRSMQQQSILYLMGPGRLLERIRQMPGLLARMPRTAWDVLVGGEKLDTRALSGASVETPRPAPPDFAAALSDQLVVLQSRIEDVLRSSSIIEAWIENDTEWFAATRIDANEAAQIAQEELADLRQWLEDRANQSPRDTRALERLLKHLPGGQRIVKLSEAAPYLLALVVAAHGAFLGPIDLLIIGGFSVATWLTEKLSNEVTARVRKTNQNIQRRFEHLGQEQVERARLWLDRQAPRSDELLKLEQAIGRIAECVER
ncbi:MAG: GTPase domain-containing protein [Phycisphaerae bacterium]|nr:GTPase domain-containing protein [Phycisphaerae bacterium]